MGLFWFGVGFPVPCLLTEPGGLHCLNSFLLLRFWPKPALLEFPVLATDIVASAILIKALFDLSVRLC